MYEKKTEESRCHVEKRFNFLDGKWNIMIICAMSDQKSIRYTELKQRLNINDMALSNALKSLINSELIERTAYNEVPPRVDYTLTEKGKSLVPVIQSMCHWSYDNYGDGDPMEHCWKHRQNRADY